jgi:WhiB family transcriptional regulator, redox-sensing transcriptional regulator
VVDAAESKWEWRLRGSCRGVPAEVFYPPDNERGPARQHREEQAKTICVSCPVRRVCRRYALEAREPYGVWGATTPREREQILGSLPIPGSGLRARPAPVAAGASVPISRGPSRKSAMVDPLA